MSAKETSRYVSCFLVNIRSLRRNLSEFVCILAAMNAKPEILVFTETWVYTYEVGRFTVYMGTEVTSPVKTVAWPGALQFI